MSRAEALKRSLAAPERFQHGTVVVEARSITSTGQTVEHGARVQSPVERYQRRGQLSQRQASAAEHLYRAWATMSGARIEGPGCPAWTPAGWRDAQITATRAYETARVAVGARLWPLVFAVAVEDWTVDRFANERGRNATATMEVLRYALDSLGDSLGLPE